MILVSALNTLSDVIRHFNDFVRIGTEKMLVFHSMNYLLNDYTVHSSKDTKIVLNKTFNVIKYTEFIDKGKIVIYKIYNSSTGKCNLSRETYEIYGKTLKRTNVRNFEAVAGRMSFEDAGNRIKLVYINNTNELSVSIPKTPFGYIITGVSIRIKK